MSAVDPLLSPDMVCELVPGLTTANLMELRKKGRGPRYSKPTGQYGKVIIYVESDVLRWVSEHMIGTRDQSL